MSARARGVREREKEDAPQAGERREVRVGRHLAEERGEQGELDAPGRFWRAVDVVLDEGLGEGRSCERAQAGHGVSELRAGWA